MDKKDEAQLTREDIADFVRTKVRLLGRRRDRRAITEELSAELAKFDKALQRGVLPDAPETTRGLRA